MTNQQLAAARKAINRFDALAVHKHGETLIPYRISDNTDGTPVIVTETMSPSEVERQLRASCLAING